MQVPYFIPRECIIKISDDTGYEPDVAVVNQPSLMNESYWESSSVIERGETMKLVVEVVSTNWRDGYALKMIDYESMGIGEYWIIDYLGIGGRRYIGSLSNQPSRFAQLWMESTNCRNFGKMIALSLPHFLT